MTQITRSDWLIPAGENKERERWSHINRTIRVEYGKLGAMRFTEVILTLIVLLLILLWLFMLPDQFPGWAEVRFRLFQHLQKTDGYRQVNLTVVNPLQRHAELFGRRDSGGKLKIYLKDTWVAVLIVFVLFIVPSGNPLRGACTLKKGTQLRHDADCRGTMVP